MPRAAALVRVGLTAPEWSAAASWGSAALELEGSIGAGGHATTMPPTHAPAELARLAALAGALAEQARLRHCRHGHIHGAHGHGAHGHGAHANSSSSSDASRRQHAAAQQEEAIGEGSARRRRASESGKGVRGKRRKEADGAASSAAAMECGGDSGEPLAGAEESFGVLRPSSHSTRREEEGNDFSSSSSSSDDDDGDDDAWAVQADPRWVGLPIGVLIGGAGAEEPPELLLREIAEQHQREESLIQEQEKEQGELEENAACSLSATADAPMAVSSAAGALVFHRLAKRVRLI